MLRPNHDPRPLMSDGCLRDDKLRILGRELARSSLCPYQFKKDIPEQEHPS